MTGKSSPITQDYVTTTETEPSQKVPGLIWRDTSGNNVELHQWTGERWETWFARGTDSPEYPVDGTQWSDGSESLRYNNGDWELINSAVSSNAEPGNKTAGILWRDTSGSNVELHQWTGGQWETWFARGPDTPEYSVEGTIWNPGDGTTQRYDGGGYRSIGLSESEVQKISQDTAAAIGTGFAPGLGG